MTNEEILKEILKKVIKNGFKHGMVDYGSIELDPNDNTIIWWYEPTAQKGASASGHFALRDIIFSHDFAKALWGEEFVDCPDIVEESLCPAWEFHLQQMVLEEDPIKYLADYVD